MAAKDGLYPVDVKGDGACLFRAVCFSECGSDNDHLILRNSAVTFLQSHKTFFSEFFTLNGDLDENLSFDDYLRKISNPFQEVGEVVLYALANVLNKCIRVYYAACEPRLYKPIDNFGALSHVSIVYQDLSSSNNGHYMALVKLPN